MDFRGELLQSNGKGKIKDVEQKAAGMIYGLACGDALGKPTEFLSLPEIKSCYGPEGIKELPEPALFTDDTEMTIALAEALIEAGREDLETLMAAVSRHFVAWFKSIEPWRSPGITCIRACQNLARGVHWRESGISHSKGCGSVMRVTPVGFFYRRDTARMAKIAHAQGVITHGHPAAVDACRAVSLWIKLALENVPPCEWLDSIYHTWPEYSWSSDWETCAARYREALSWAEEEKAMDHIGQGWVAEEAALLALYCVVRYPDDYVAVVRRGANSNGDSDSIACIAGALAGALLGVKAIPHGWWGYIERSDYLANLALRLTEASDGV